MMSGQAVRLYEKLKHHKALTNSRHLAAIVNMIRISMLTAVCLDCAVYLCCSLTSSFGVGVFSDVSQRQFMTGSLWQAYRRCPALPS